MTKNWKIMKFIRYILFYYTFFSKLKIINYLKWLTLSFRTWFMGSKQQYSLVQNLIMKIEVQPWINDHKNINWCLYVLNHVGIQRIATWNQTRFFPTMHILLHLLPLLSIILLIILSLVSYTLLFLKNKSLTLLMSPISVFLLIIATSFLLFSFSSN